MPYTSDGKYFPYTADGILASKRHQMNLDAEKRTMGKKRQGETPPPGVMPRHLDPNHPMNRENNRQISCMFAYSLQHYFQFI